MKKMFLIRINVLLCIFSWNVICQASNAKSGASYVAHSNEQSKIIKVAPSAIGGQLKVTFKDVHGEVAILQFMDKSGVVIFNEIINRGVQSIQMDISNLENGTYNLSMKGENINESLEVIKNGK